MLYDTYRRDKFPFDIFVNQLNFHASKLKFDGDGRRKLNWLNCLVIGCGDGDFAYALAKYCPVARYLGYDINPKKIGLAKPFKGKFEKYSYDSAYSSLDVSLDFTLQRPKKKFDIVIAHNILHEDPKVVLDDIVSFSKPGGVLGVLDYDMKGMVMDEFLACFCSKPETQELQKMGEEKCHEVHTRYSAQEYIRMIESRGFSRLFFQCDLPARFGLTRHFIYFGTRE